MQVYIYIYIHISILHIHTYFHFFTFDVAEVWLRRTNYGQALLALGNELCFAHPWEKAFGTHAQAKPSGQSEENKSKGKCPYNVAKLHRR